MYFLHLFHAGGFMMYPLLLCSIIVVAIFFERYRYYSSHRSNTERLSAVMTDSLNRGDIEGLKDALKTDGGIPAGVLLSAVNVYGTKAHQATIIEGAAAHAAGLLKNYLNYLDVIVTLSPLMGLLGTVIGMIGSFGVLSTADGPAFCYYRRRCGSISVHGNGFVCCHYSVNCLYLLIPAS